VCINNYSNRERYDKVIAKIKWCSFLPYSVYVSSLHYSVPSFLKRTRGLQNKSSGVPYVDNTIAPQIYNRELYRTDLSKRESYLV